MSVAARLKTSTLYGVFSMYLFFKINTTRRMLLMTAEAPMKPKSTRRNIFSSSLFKRQAFFQTGSLLHKPMSKSRWPTCRDFSWDSQYQTFRKFSSFLISTETSFLQSLDIPLTPSGIRSSRLISLELSSLFFTPHGKLSASVYCRLSSSKLKQSDVTDSREKWIHFHPFARICSTWRSCGSYPMRFVFITFAIHLWNTKGNSIAHMTASIILVSLLITNKHYKPKSAYNPWASTISWFLWTYKRGSDGL